MSFGESPHAKRLQKRIETMEVVENLTTPGDGTPVMASMPTGEIDSETAGSDLTDPTNEKNSKGNRVVPGGSASRPTETADRRAASTQVTKVAGEDQTAGSAEMKAILPDKALQPSTGCSGSQGQSSTTWDGLPPIRKEEDISCDKGILLPKEIVAGVVHKGTKAVLVGSSKCGKSWALLQLAMCVAAGVPWLASNTAPGRVLYVNFEIIEAAFAERIRRVKQALLEDHGELDLDKFEIQTMRGSAVTFSDYIERLIRRLKGQDYSLIIIDPFYKGMVGRDENKASAVNPLCALLDKLAQETGAAVVLAHHYWQSSSRHWPRPLPQNTAPPAQLRNRTKGKIQTSKRI